MKFFLLPCIFLCTLVWAQEKKDHHNLLYLELAGSGGLASLNYEQDFFQHEKVGLYWRTGFSVAPIDKNNGVGLVFPLMVHSSFGGGSGKLDLGLGHGFTVTTKGNWFFLATTCVGYRYQKPDSRWFFRLAYTPLISYLFDFQVQHWGGLSIGYSMNW